MAITNRHLLLSVFDPGTRSKLESVARDLAICVRPEDSPAALLTRTDLCSADAIILECGEVGAEVLAFLEHCRQSAPEVPVVGILTRHSSADAARFSRNGGFECLDTSSTTDEFHAALQSAQAFATRARAARAALAEEPWRRQLVGSSSPMDQVIRVIRLVASRRCTVLISGETGTGKEMAARAIHFASNRSRRPMVSVNCSAIPENLIEAELFGHVKGAYTGASGNRVGRFEQASGGTLFLDEIADLPIELQPKLLRVLQEKEIQRLGSSETIKVDVRVIVATNADLLARVQEGRFREDLYYRLNVVPIHMPALRDRISDVPLLVNHFIEKICTAEGMPLKRVSSDVLNGLLTYSWPGNVRQVENVVEHAVVMSGDRECLHASDFALPKAASLPCARQAAVLQAAAGASEMHLVPGSDLPADGLDFSETLRQFERAILQQAMSRAQGNKTLAADMLRLPRTTLIHKLRVLEPALA